MCSPPLNQRLNFLPNYARMYRFLFRNSTKNHGMINHTKSHIRLGPLLDNEKKFAGAQIHNEMAVRFRHTRNHLLFLTENNKFCCAKF